ncbi:hypothetical protein [Micromonospora sp. 4G55]|uniref:hypothetical protein n=1 Tax=Micromonospora sp. 4G55 TaxID=2806102 RepID=UPI001A3631CD|nr:hypothetical protein [Micromonospora sp. 4G55]MBM0259199.1 hypothetical protein [Micromonospora sp. 4G55]
MPSLLHGAAGGGGRAQPATATRAQGRYDQAPGARRRRRRPASPGAGGAVLHPGRAVVRFELHDAYQGTTLTETTRSVRIPR